MTGDEARCLAAGMDAYVSKPFQPDEVCDVIERYLTASNIPALHPTPRARVDVGATATPE